MKAIIASILILLTATISIAQTPLAKPTTAKDTLKKALKDIKLKEVSIQGKKPLIQMEIDKTIVNVGAMISSSTSNTMEVLEKTPGVTIDANGNISLNGRSGVMVLIDGKQTYMSAGDLANYLKTLPGRALIRSSC